MSRARGPAWRAPVYHARPARRGGEASFEL